MKKTIPCLLLFLTLFLTACSQTEKLEIKPVPPVIEEVRPSLVVYTPEVAVLVDKSKDITNYHYLFDAGSGQGYDVFVRQEKVRKVYLDPVKLDQEIYYNEVYLDLTQKTAIGICSKVGVTCEKAWGKKYTLNFDRELPMLFPVDLVKQIPFSAQKVGEAVVDRHDTVIIEFKTEDGNVEQLFLDTFTGLPLQQLIFEQGNKEKPLLGKHTFANTAVKNVLASEVTLPESYVFGE